MNIKRADDKPMVIHTKKKAKLHAVRSRRISVKGRNVLTVERGSRLRRAYIRPVKKPTARSKTPTLEKDMELKRNMAQGTSKAALNEQKNLGDMRQQQNYRREINTSQPQSRQGDTRKEQTSYRDATQQKVRSYKRTQYQPRQVSPEQKIRKKDTAVTIAAATATSKTSEQLDGGEEFRDAASVSDQLTNPLLSAGSKGAQYFKEKTLEERKRRIKVVEQRKTIDRIKISGRKNMSGSDNSIHKSQSVDDDSREDTAADQKQDLADTKRNHRYYTHKKYKQQDKRRVAKRKNPNTSISAEPLYTAKGHAYTTTSDYRASREITRQDAAVVTRKRKIRQYVNQLAVENRKSETIIKKVKEQAAKKLSLWIRSIAPKVGGILAAVALILAVVALPTLSMVTIIYNSPLAIFFPPVEDGDTVQSVIQTYEQEFHHIVEDLANTHPGHDEGELVYVDYEGIGGAPSNLYDMIAVYMVKHGVGETATIVNDISRAWMKQVVDDMCTYTTSTRIETYPDGEGGSYTITILCVNVMLKSYRDMISVYDFDENEIELLEIIMNPENLAMLGANVGGGGGVTVQSLLTTAEIEAILQNVTNPTQRSACYFALSKVGYPYSQDYRDSGDYYDCSSLAFYAWKAAGKNISYQGLNSAASEAQGLEAAGKVVSYSEMQPGDLIFYSYEINNRYKNISHVAIYIGNGKVVEAKGTNYGVIYGDVPNQGKIVTICRP
ncbi:MAG: NlpC/P60 family protein [Lachnospiraceae bacterium]